ncbi:MAG: 2-polyprenyl-3-methyl-5-hydroxy-6-metoxy-1 4-benzoquinol methylase [Rhodospirillaceae bacterium]|nr:MAG: 2-polyprenyl-3-methyl-5-hydroxy-6-metoxy-1 4-benzoquinol methylase [Rhodospirillaceae bacterium]
MERKRNSDVLAELVTLPDRQVVDVGCGDGALARFMARRGARVLGIDTSLVQLARARAEPAVAGETFVQGDAAHLPVPDAAVDVVVFFNSLHHVPPESLDQALAEAGRVLRAQGIVYVAEPVAAGSFFALCQPVDDETTVRALAQTALDGAGRHGLAPERTRTYLHTVLYPDFAAWCAHLVAVDARRTARVLALKPALRESYARLGTPAAHGGRAFDQPMQVTVLRNISL